MPTQITSHTTNEEIQDIYEHYRRADGQVDYDAIATAILGNEGTYDTEDLITAYVSGTGTLPPAFMAPESFFADPSAYPQLWEDEVISSLQQLGDLYERSVGTAIERFLDFADTRAGTDSGSLLNEVRRFLDEETGLDDEETERAAGGIIDLFNVNDLREIMTLFISMGNPGLALLLYTAYGLDPAMRELQEAALDVIGDSGDTMDDLMNDLQDLDPEDLTAQYESQAISQQLGVVTTVIQTMQQFIRDAQDALQRAVETSTNLSEGAQRGTESIIRNMS